MTLLSYIASAIGTAWSNLALGFTSYPQLTAGEEEASLLDADREERDLRILMSHWF